MKKNIVVCCSEMLKALGRGLKYLDDVDCDGKLHNGVYLEDVFGMPPLACCPWCGEALALPYEEEE